MTPDSWVASRFASSLGHRRHGYSPRKSYSAIIVHTTGGRLIDRWRRQGPRHGEHTAFATALRVYTTMMRSGPHYVIGQEGQCVQVMPESLAAWHVGRAGSGRYQWTRWRRSSVAWWDDRWRGLDGPRDLAGGRLWAGGSCNANAIGVEVVANEDDPRGRKPGSWSPFAWYALANLVLDVCERRDIPLVQDRIITHSDAHPLARTARGQPWDTTPHQFSWARLEATTQERVCREA